MARVDSRMIRRARQFLAAWTVLAVVALSYASTQSIVMQTVDGGGMPVICSMQSDGSADMATAEKAWLTHAPGLPGKAKRAACPFCSAAAHPPLLSAAAFLQSPMAVRWVPVAPIASTGARGPPLIRANARAPPVLTHDF